MKDNDKYNNGSTGRIDPKDFKLNLPEEEFRDDTLDRFGATTQMNPRGGIRDEEENDYYAVHQAEKNRKKEHRQRDKVKSHKNRRIFRIVWLAMVVLVGLSLASYLISGSNDFFAIGKPEGSVAVEIPEGVTEKQLANILYEAGAINEPEFFALYCAVTTDMEYFGPGSYSVPTNLDYEGIISTLQYSQDVRKEVEITFQEGMNIEEMAAKLEENGVASADEILAAANTSDFDQYDMIGAITNADQKYYKLEGYLFPDTYWFYEDEDIDSVLGKLLNNFQIRVTSDIVEQVENSGYSLDEIITMASIIQQEAANKEDMYMVSAVLHNRLEWGNEVDIYTLGCDSTMFYPYRTAEDAPAEYTSKYNTYEISGLPAGPICSPGIDAIRAALNPSEEGSDYLYFCHDAEGNAYYASTEEGHYENRVAAGLVD